MREIAPFPPPPLLVRTAAGGGGAGAAGRLSLSQSRSFGGRRTWGMTRLVKVADSTSERVLNVIGTLDGNVGCNLSHANANRSIEEPGIIFLIVDAARHG